MPSCLDSGAERAFEESMLPKKYFILLFFMQTNLKNLTPVRKPASIYGMDSVNGKMSSGCLIFKV